MSITKCEWWFHMSIFGNRWSNVYIEDGGIDNKTGSEIFAIIANQCCTALTDDECGTKLKAKVVKKKLGT